MTKKKKKNCARQELEWLLPISSTRSRSSFEVVTCRVLGALGRGARHAGKGRCEHNLGQTRRGRDVQLVSRPGLEGWRCDILFGVATW